MSEQERERKNQVKAFFTTSGIVVLLTVLCFFILAFRMPYPPGPGIGVELNFGLDDEGGGDIQPTEPVISAPLEQPVEAENKEESVKEETPQEPDDEAVVTQDQEETGVVIKEKEVKPTEKVFEKEVKKDPVPNPETKYVPNKQKAGTADSHGDDKGKVGDEGDPNGVPNAKAMSGIAGNGGGGGGSLDLKGWRWDKKPNPVPPKGEMGGILKFQIIVDDNGDIIKIITLEKGTSNPETERIFRSAVENSTFDRVGNQVPDRTTGTITFVIRPQ